MPKNKTTFVVISQTIHDRDSSGKRFPKGAVKLSRVKTWNRYRNNNNNLKAAIINAHNKLLKENLGSIVSIQKYTNGLPTKYITKIYQCKWGHDKKPFSRYEHCNSLDRIEAHIPVLMSNCKPYTIEDLSKYLGVTDDVTTISIDRLIKLNLIIY